MAKRTKPADRESYYVLAVELFDWDKPLRQALGTIVVGGMIKHRTRPEKIQICDERLRHVLQPMCDRLHIELEQVDELVAAPDALANMVELMRGGQS